MKGAIGLEIPAQFFERHDFRDESNNVYFFSDLLNLIHMHRYCTMDEYLLTELYETGTIVPYATNRRSGSHDQRIKRKSRSCLFRPGLLFSARNYPRPPYQTF